MATFIEVDSVEKGCKVIINLDEIIEIAPLAVGGCVLFFADSAAVNGKSAYPVKDSYDQFKQFAMQTVTAESIASRFPSKKEKTEKLEIPKL
jgi:hypothetical protein